MGALRNILILIENLLLYSKLSTYILLWPFDGTLIRRIHRDCGWKHRQHPTMFWDDDESRINTMPAGLFAACCTWTWKSHARQQPEHHWMITTSISHNVWSPIGVPVTLIRLSFQQVLFFFFSPSKKREENHQHIPSLCQGPWYYLDTYI